MAVKKIRRDLVFSFFDPRAKKKWFPKIGGAR